ncbi:MAG: hypothetical protein LUD55_04190, partial [Oscillospiraceae bacterium]|nr:hypothetical protein [Oscillospiraceae bacterium]
MKVVQRLRKSELIGLFLCKRCFSFAEKGGVLMAALPINNKTRRRQLRLLLAGLFAAMVVIFLISMTQGIYPLSLHEIFQIIGSLLGFSTIGLYDGRNYSPDASGQHHAHIFHRGFSFYLAPTRPKKGAAHGSMAGIKLNVLPILMTFNWFYNKCWGNPPPQAKGCT